jgi:hypothetical protein
VVTDVIRNFTRGMDGVDFLHGIVNEDILRSVFFDTVCRALPGAQAGTLGATPAV